MNNIGTLIIFQHKLEILLTLNYPFHFSFLSSSDSVNLILSQSKNSFPVISLS